MYNELYEIWKKELENAELQKLSPNFYSRITDYLKKSREESRMLDKRTVKANLLEKEMKNVKRMVSELIRERYRKLVKKMAKGEKIPVDVLTTDERRLYKEFSLLGEAYRIFMESILHGHVPNVDVEQKHKRSVLRFVKDVPQIIGADMQTYGVFNIGDVASLPKENAEIMIKQGLAEKVEVNK